MHKGTLLFRAQTHRPALTTTGALRNAEEAEGMKIFAHPWATCLSDERVSPINRAKIFVTVARISYRDGSFLWFVSFADKRNEQLEKKALGRDAPAGGKNAVGHGSPTLHSGKTTPERDAQVCVPYKCL